MYREIKHPDLSEKSQSQIIFFVIILPIISLGLSLISASFINIPDIDWLNIVFGSISAMAGYRILYSLFDRKLYKWGLFRKIGIVSVPIIEGRWRGLLTSSFGGDPIDVVMEIEQSFSSVYVRSFFKKSSSVSISSIFLLGRINIPELHYEYQNEPNKMADEDMYIHYGLGVIVLETPNTIRGHYYNAGEYKRGNIGTYNLEFESKKLLAHF